MSEPLPGLAAPLSLSERQRFALVVVRERGPIASEELGAHVHAWRRSRGGRGHGPDERCAYCASEGASLGRILQRKGLVRRRRGEGWVEIGYRSPTPASAQLGPDDPWPEGF